VAAVAERRRHAVGPRYKWTALSNTSLAVLMSAVDGSIVIIALPAIFNGIHLDPLAPGNVAYLLWMIMGYRLVQAVLVVTLGATPASGSLPGSTGSGTSRSASGCPPSSSP
jgi:hypothetical protein